MRTDALDGDAGDATQSAEPVEDASILPRWYRENPDRLKGEALHKLARARGIPASTIARLDDDRLRTEIHAINRMRMDDEAEAEQGAP